MIKLSAILISISAIAKGFCDAIRFHPANFPFQGDWWLGKGDYAWNNRTLLEKYVFSFVSDAWHLFDAIRITAFLLLVALLIVDIKKGRKEIDQHGWIAAALLVIAMYFIHGSVFEITFKLL